LSLNKKLPGMNHERGDKDKRPSITVSKIDLKPRRVTAPIGGFPSGWFFHGMNRGVHPGGIGGKRGIGAVRFFRGPLYGSAEMTIRCLSDAPGSRRRENTVSRATLLLYASEASAETDGKPSVFLLGWL
jgi:hypothetical protein